jgi:hypothetical protein
MQSRSEVHMFEILTAALTIIAIGVVSHFISKAVKRRKIRARRAKIESAKRSNDMNWSY